MRQNLYNGSDVLRNISRIEIRQKYIFIFFNDGCGCELDFSGSCSRQLLCASLSNSKCRMAVSGACEIIKLIKQKADFISSCILKPDWISKVTKSGNGWEVFRK